MYNDFESVGVYVLHINVNFLGVLNPKEKNNNEKKRKKIMLEKKGLIFLLKFDPFFNRNFFTLKLVIFANSSVLKCILYWLICNVCFGVCVGRFMIHTDKAAFKLYMIQCTIIILGYLSKFSASLE